jgi:glucokinase
VPKQRGKHEKHAAIALEIASGAAEIALVDRSGQIRRRRQARTLWGRSALATIEPYLRAIEYLLACAQADGMRVYGIGVALPGVLDEAARRPRHLPILPSLNNFPLCDLLEARYDLPTRLFVDMDAALIGEYYYGAGQGYERLLYMSLNAVVGASSIIDGQLVGGSEIQQPYMGSVGHVAHVTISATGQRCGCGKRGCINSFVSQEAIQKMVLRVLRRGDETSITQRVQQEPLSLQLLWEEALRGDEVALRIYSDVERWLSEAIVRSLRVFEPDILILGGAMPCESPSFLARIREAAMTADQQFRIAKAQLGREGILIGVTAPFFARPAEPVTESDIPALYKIEAE